MLKMPASKWLTSCVVKCRLTKEGGEAMRMPMAWATKKGEEVSGKRIEERLAMELMKGLQEGRDLCQSKVDQGDLRFERGRELWGESRIEWPEV